jgi:integrase/recombinase XerD
MKSLVLTNQSYKVIVQDFRQWLDIIGYAETTVYNLPNHLKEFFHYLEQNKINRINEINTQSVLDYYDHLKTRPNERRSGALSKGHLNKHQQALFKFREYLKEHHHSGIHIHLKRESKNEKDSLNVLTQTEIKELFQATEYSHEAERIRHRDKAILVCCYSCGLRRNELVHLNIRDVLFDKKRLFVSQGKNYKERFVPLNNHSLKILEEYIYDWRTEFYNYKETESLFINYRGKRLQGKSFANRLESIIKATKNTDLEYRNITLHSLRHSIATHLLEQGAAMEQISIFLGHASLESTQIYTHFLSAKAEIEPSKYEEVQKLLRKQSLQQQKYPNIPKKRRAI